MRLKSIVIFVATAAWLTFCPPLYADNAPKDPQAITQGSKTSNEDLHARQSALFDQAEKNANDAHRKNVELLAREEKMMASQESMMARQEQDLERFEKILATWERQQAQYQLYLDSLSKGGK